MYPHLPVPVLGGGKLALDDCSVPLVDAGQIDLGDELDQGGYGGVIICADYHKAVEPIVVGGLGRAHDGGIPGGKEGVIGDGQAEGNGPICDSLLGSLELLKKFEVSGN